MVRHLATFIRDKNHCYGCSYKIDIRKEIELFKRRNPGETPKIVFDFMACICMAMDGNPMEVFTGGRQLKCVQLAKEFCEKFKELNVELVFFVDGPIKDIKIPHYIEGANQKYDNQQSKFESLRNEGKLKCFIASPKMSVYVNNFLTTIRKYSKISISFTNECDVDIANYATKINALAVVTCDTDFLIFEGNWQIWLSKSFKKETFSTIAWNKRNLMKCLNLKPSHMPVFATLMGNDFVKYEYVKYFHSDENGSIPKQKILAQYISKEFPRGVPLSRAQFNRLSEIVYNSGKNNINFKKAKEIVSCSLDSYNYERRQNSNVEVWLKQYIQCTNCIVPYQILKNLTITINQSWIDMSIPEFKPYSELVIPIVRRQMGILLDHKRQQYPERKICYKPSHEEPFQIKIFPPIYYDKKERRIPNLEHLLQSPNKTSKEFEWDTMKDIISLEEKFAILSWNLSPTQKNLTSELLIRFCDSPFLIPMICANYLVKESQITIEEADVLLISIHEAVNMNIEKFMSLKPPETIKSRHHWISTVYTRFFEICRSSLVVCGLFRFSKISHFDGFLFHKMLQKFPTLDKEIKKKELEKIKEFRIYA